MPISAQSGVTHALRRTNFEPDNFVPRLILPHMHLSVVGMAFDLDLDAVQTEGANEAGVGISTYSGDF